MTGGGKKEGGVTPRGKPTEKRHRIRKVSAGHRNWKLSSSCFSFLDDLPTKYCVDHQGWDLVSPEWTGSAHRRESSITKVMFQSMDRKERCWEIACAVLDWVGSFESLLVCYVLTKRWGENGRSRGIPLFLIEGLLLRIKRKVWGDNVCLFMCRTQEESFGFENEFEGSGLSQWWWKDI